MFSGTNVKEITLSDFDDSGNLPKYKGKTLILFYATWCGHCQHFKPVFVDLAKNGKANYLAVNMSSPSEMTKNKMNNWKFKVQGYPTIVSFYNGQPYSIYQGDRTVKDLMGYLNNVGKNWGV